MRNRKANNFVVTDDSWKRLWKKLQDFENFLLVQNKNLRGGKVKNIFWKMLGSGRNYYHSMRKHKANNFVVTDDSWKCLWKKLQDFENFLLVQNKNLRGGVKNIFWKMLGSGRKYYHSTRNHMTNNFVVFDDSWNCLWKKLQDFEKVLLVQNKNLRGGGQKYFLKNAQIGSKILPFDA